MIEGEFNQNPYAFLDHQAAGFESIASNPQVEKTLKEVSQVTLNNRQIFRLALDQLALHDPNLRGSIDRLDTLGLSLSTLHQRLETQVAPLPQTSVNILRKNPDLDPSFAEEDLKQLEERGQLGDLFLADLALEKKGQQSLGTIPAIRQALLKREYQRAFSLVDQLKDQAEDSKLLWDKTVLENNLDPTLVDEFDEMSDLIELYRINQVVKEAALPEGDQKTLLAKVIKDHFNPGKDSTINPVLLEEVINGRFELEDKFVETLVDTYLGFEEADKSSSPATLKQNTLKTAMRAVGVAILIANLTPLASEVIQKTPAVIEQLVKKPDQNKGFEVSTKPNSEHTQSLTARKPESSHHPENSDEDIEQASKTDIWEIEAGPLGVNGYFKEQTAEVFYSNTLEWGSEENLMYDFSVDQGGDKEYALKRKVGFGDNSIAVPVREGEVPFAKGTKVVDSTGKNISFVYDAFVDGTFRLRTLESYSGEINVYIPIGKNDKGIQAIPGGSNYNKAEVPRPEYQQSALLARDLPKDAWDLLVSIQNLSDLDKASKIQDYFKNNFTYSLDSKWSDFYDNSSSPQEYYSKLFDIRRGDCDVVNSLMVQFMREAGLSAKMTYGYIHEGQFSTDKSKITALEMHGYGRVYDFKNKKWVVFDGTPTKMDDSTQKKFEKLQGQGNSSGSLGDLAKELGDEFKLFSANYKFLSKHLGLNPSIPLGVLEGLVGIIAAKTIDKKIKEKAQRVMRARKIAAENVIDKIEDTRPSWEQAVMASFNDTLFNLIRSGKRDIGGSWTYLLTPVRLKYHRHMREATKVLDKMRSDFVPLTKLDPNGEFDSVGFIERATGIDKKEIEDEVTERNVGHLSDGLGNHELAQFVRHILPGYGLHGYLKPYYDAKNDWHSQTHIRGDDMLSVLDSIKDRYIYNDAWYFFKDKSTSPQEYVEAYLQEIYASISKDLGKATKRYQRKHTEVPPHSFPQDYESFRRAIPRSVDRFLISRWLLRNEQI